MTPPLGEPACPGADRTADTPSTTPPPAAPRLAAVRAPFETVDRETWDRLASANPWATPFARWAFHRGWWDAYGASAHDQTLLVVDADAAPGAPPVAIV